MTTHTVKDASLRTILWYTVEDGPTREYAKGTFVVDLVSVVVDTTASEQEASQWTAYLSGPADPPRDTYVRGQVVHSVEASKKTLKWLGPIVQDTIEAHVRAMAALSA